jgi:SAM-dependent methyltransferase
MNPHTSEQQTLLDIYARHPLRERTILERIMRQRGTLDGITELDLAQDSLTEITDQNHVGGVAFVVQLAACAGIGATSRVLDIGSGLGGSTRCLAHLFGCHAHGVELTPLRCEEGARLTQRVHLDRLVTSTCGDILAVDLPSRAFDVIWGQGAWIHIADTAALFARAAGAITSGGCLVFEEACLTRVPRADESRLLERQELLWGGRFLPHDGWRGALGSAGFTVQGIDNLTGAFVAHFQRLSTIARTHGAGAYPPNETEAFEHAIALAKAGVIGYARFLARFRS